MTKTILVTGATGQQGGGVARELLKKGRQVRAFIRNTESASAVELKNLGATLAQGDYNDIDSIKSALNGVNSVFIVTNMYEGIENESVQGIRFVDLAVEAGVEHIVFSSVAGANTGSGIPHFESKYKVEERLVATATNWTIVAPVFFMDNLTFAWNLPSLQAGKLRQAINEDTELQMIAAEDIGKFHAHVLDNGAKFYGQRIEIAGDQLTGPEAAGIISGASGKEIHFEVQPREEVAALMEDVALMYDWFIETGYSANVDALRSEYPEIGWKSFSDWSESQDWDSLLAAEPASV